MIIDSGEGKKNRRGHFEGGNKELAAGGRGGAQEREEKGAL